MSLGKRLISTGGVAACTTDSTDPFGDSSGVALYNLDYDASTAPDGTDYSGTPTNVEFGVGGKINYGARFNGSSSAIDGMTNSYVFDNTNKRGSLSFWVNFASLSTTQALINRWDNRSGDNSVWGLWYVNGSDYLQFTHRDSSNNNTVATSNTSLFTINTWHHISLVWNQSTVTFYVDSLEEGTVTNSNFNDTLDTAAGELTFGATRRTSPLYQEVLNGSLDQVRIFSKALDSTEVSTLWNSGNGETACVYTSTTDIVNYPAGTTPVAYIPFDNSAEDLVSGDLGTLGSGTEFRFGRFGQAMVGNQNTWSADFPNISETANSPFSVSCWLNIADRNSTIYFFLWSSGFGSSSAWGGLLSGQSGKYYTNFGNQVLVSSSSVVPPLNQWFHYVLTYDGTNVKVYSDTEKVIDGNINTSALGSNNLKVLYNGSSSEAKIDQMRIYDSALTSSQVTELYNEKPEVDTSTFKTVLYEGTGATQYISNVGIDLETNGGLVWIKNRDSAYNHYLYDSVRGAKSVLISDSTLANTVQTNGLSSFEANGFFVEGNRLNVNENNSDIVAWVWKGGGDAVNIGVNSITGSTPSIASDVSASDKGFSIVKWTSDGTTQTMGHGLNIDGTATTPELIITKATNVSRSWYVWANGFTTGEFLSLNSNAAKSSVSNLWGSLPTSTVFSYDGSQINNNDQVVAYCFASVSGYSKIGSYTGNGSSTGPIIETGFEPQFVMVKSSSIAGNWNIHDNKRGESLNDAYLFANLSNAEVVNSAGRITFSSNGFQISTSDVSRNSIGATYIYMAFK